MSRQRLTALTLWLACLAAAAWLVAKTPVVTDLTAFLPGSDSSETQRLLDQLQQGPASRLVLIGIAAGTPPQGAALARQLATMLGDDPQFVRVLNGAQSMDLAAYEQLLRYRYLLSPHMDAQHFGAQSLRNALEQRLRELASPLGMLDKPLLASDPTGEVRAMLAAWTSGSGAPARRHGVWFSADGSRALLLAETRAAGFDIDRQQRAVDSIRAAFEAARTTTGTASTARLELSGPAVFAVNSRDRIRGEAQLLSLVATVAVLAILLAAYRSVRILLLGALPLASAILVGIAAVGAVFGYIHGITLAFGITLLGIAIDYPIHLFSHLRPASGVLRSLLHIWPTLRTGVLTSVVGYLAMTTTDFTGLTQLGLFAICGLLAAAAVTRWVLPSLLPPRWAPCPQPPAAAARLLRHLPASRPLRGVALALCGVALATLLVAPPTWENDLAALSPVPAAERALDGRLRGELGAPDVTHLVVISDRDVQGALERTEELAQRLRALVEAGAIRGFDAPTVYLPSVATQLRRQQSLPDATSLRRALDLASRDTPFRHGAFEPFVAAITESRTLAPLRPADLAGTPPGLRLESLLHAGQNSWSALVLLSGVRDHARFTEWFAQQDLDGARYLDIKSETSQLVVEYRNAALARLAVGSLLIVALLGPALRSAGRLLRVLVPVAMAIVIDLLALMLLGERLSLFHLVSLLLVVGIGLDYSLFFSRPGDDHDSRARTLHAVLVCAGSTVTVFAILALSDIPVLHAIGTTVAIGVFAALAAALILAPEVRPKAREDAR